jgi:hypothetical protein
MALRRFSLRIRSPHHFSPPIQSELQTGRLLTPEENLLAWGNHVPAGREILCILCGRQSEFYRYPATKCVW